MQFPPLASVLCLTIVSLAQTACVTVDVQLSSFVSADRSPRTANLAPGYAVQDLTIHRGNQAIGITHAHHPESHALIVFLGGNSFHRSIEGGEVLEALAHDADVVLFDYPGYGDSTGTPETASILDTARAVYDYATSLATSAGKKRVLYGFSLGGLAAAYIARDRPADGIVLEATAPNVERWARSQIPWYMKPLVAARVAPELANLDAPTALRYFGGDVLVLSSRADRRAPQKLSAQLHSQLRHAGVRSEWVRFDQARHGGIAQSPEFRTTLESFLARVRVRS